MPSLPNELRNKLERVVIEARDAAETGALAALEALAVHEKKYYPHMSPEQQKLRNHLRARARQLGDKQVMTGQLSLAHLAGECAYEHWHRMLFSRLLAENSLLIEPSQNMAISLAEAEELAKEEGLDVWVFTSRCAEKMLPQIFRPDDPLLQVSFAREHLIKLEDLLDSLPASVFTASDSLGWVYQFWQSKKKEEVNRSEVKIGADEISAVTQLFTEPYMVEFLLHNTLGAWWAGKKLSDKDVATAKTENELRTKVALSGVNWEYLRFVRGAEDESEPWRPASGTFDGWPQTAAELKVLDPCCGSGHFLVAALHHLVPIRMVEEGLTPTQAIDAVLHDNLHGLEIDERCCQIAAFALAFAAWTYPDTSGYRSLPELHIACTGIGPQSTEEQWLQLIEKSTLLMPNDQRERIKNGLLNLHRLFSQAPTLGSLINPADLPVDLMTADYQTIQPYLEEILGTEKADDITRERAIVAAGMVKAAEVLNCHYALIITNPPFLGLEKHSEVLEQYVKSHHTHAKRELALCMFDRCTQLSTSSGTLAFVLPGEWTFVRSHREFRKHLLNKEQIKILARLGAKAFISPIRVNPILLVSSQIGSKKETETISLDVSPLPLPEKPTGLITSDCTQVSQDAWQAAIDCRLLLLPTQGPSHGCHIEDLADSRNGLSVGDGSRFEANFWELPSLGDKWGLLQSSSAGTLPFGGRDCIVRWENECGEMAKLAESVKHLNHSAQNWRRGKPLWGRVGVIVNQIGAHTTIYGGEKYDSSCFAIVPDDSADTAALIAFALSGKLKESLKLINPTWNLKSPKTLLQLPFDLNRWQLTAKEMFPQGLPQPHSNDPTQWLFHGRPEESTSPLLVGVARLLGYHWPAELDDKMRLSERAREQVERCEELAKFADDDGIVCIPSVRGEESAAERLERLLTATGIKPARLRELAGDIDLDQWLRNNFFDEHCKLFHNRPFIWHIWDGRKQDGFHALVNYHKLAEADGEGRKVLESLTYSYLGDWISRQKDGVKRGEEGAEDRLAAAIELQKRLESILAGEPPFDIFVRWKPLAKQSIGWDPDINDGVRLNIRPFMAGDLPNGRTGAGVLRYKPNIKWGKDRGKEPYRTKAEYPWFWSKEEPCEDFLGGKEFHGNRWNGCHYTNKVKHTIREAVKIQKGKS
ncbi:MAG: Eco57I restriction-modification methylase domain-containing protein [Thermoleophilia bacterium]